MAVRLSVCYSTTRIKRWKNLVRRLLDVHVPCTTKKWAGQLLSRVTVLFVRNYLGWICVPIVLESYGAWKQIATDFVSKLASRLGIHANRDAQNHLPCMEI